MEYQINIEWQDQNGNWQHYQSKQNQADAYRVRSQSMIKQGHTYLDRDGDGEASESKDSSHTKSR